MGSDCISSWSLLIFLLYFMMVTNHGIFIHTSIQKFSTSESEVQSNDMSEIISNKNESDINKELSLLRNQVHDNKLNTFSKIYSNFSLQKHLSFGLPKAKTKELSKLRVCAHELLSERGSLFQAPSSSWKTTGITTYRNGPTYLPTQQPTHQHTNPTIYLPSHLPTCVPTYQHSYLPTYTHTYLPTYLPTNTYITLFGSFLSYPALPFSGSHWSSFRYELKSVMVHFDTHRSVPFRFGTHRSPFRYFRRSVSVRSCPFRSVPVRLGPFRSVSVSRDTEKRLVIR